MIKNKILLSFLGKLAFLWIYKSRWHKRREKNMTPVFIFIWEVHSWTFRSSFSSSYYMKKLLRQNVLGAFMIFNYEVFQQPYTALFHHQHFLGKQRLANFQIYCLLSSELHQHSVESDPIPILLILLDLLLRHHWK